MITPDERRATVRALVAAELPGPDEEVSDGPAPDGGSPDGGSPGTVAWLQRLCRAAVRALPVNGAGVSLMTAAGVHAVAAASDPSTEMLEGLQITLGEGPCIDAFTTRRPVLAPDLVAGGARRWPAYTAAALADGAGAVFAFPLQIGAARLGVLDVYRRSPGMLTAASLAQALTFAEITVETLLVGQERAPQGRTEATLDQALNPQYLVYQAQGMAMVDLRISLPDAMARLQAYAYAHDRPLHDVAHDIVNGRLRLEPDLS
jgi:GAF domain/ANTAR domain